MNVYYYMCCNGACRFTFTRTGMRKSMVPCPVCGAQARLIRTEKN